jgi:hypothetical protein
MRVFAVAREHALDDDLHVDPVAANSGPNADRICTWQEEARGAVRQSDSLSPAACDAVARLLKRFLEEEEPGDDDEQGEMRTLITLLNAAAQRPTRDEDAAIADQGRPSAGSVRLCRIQAIDA